MPVFASLVCGFVFGCGLTISGMVQPAKVLGFLDVFGIPGGTWDPSLAVVMGAALIIASIGYAVVGRRPPLFGKESLWPTKTDIDRPLLSGALLVRYWLGSCWAMSRTGRRKSGNLIDAGDRLRHCNGNRHAGSRFVASTRCCS
jgi:Family of unknown function (DUF6691)